MSVKVMSFLGACRDFFGYKPGETGADFYRELKELTLHDRAEITAGLEQNGYKIEEPSHLQAA